MDTQQLQRQIMRRVYYSFGLSIISDTMFVSGMFLSIAAYLLAQWLHVASIINNFLSVPVRQAPTFVLDSFVGAVTHGEFMTACVVLASGLVGLVCAWRLSRALIFTQSMVRV